MSKRHGERAIEKFGHGHGTRHDTISTISRQARVLLLFLRTLKKFAKKNVSTRTSSPSGVRAESEWLILLLSRNLECVLEHLLEEENRDYDEAKMVLLRHFNAVTQADCEG